MLKKKDVSFINLEINFIDATLNAFVPKKLTSKLFWSHVLKEMGHNKSLSSPSLSHSFYVYNVLKSVPNLSPDLGTHPLLLK